MSVLSNITAIKVRATYQPYGIGFLDDFRLHTARHGAAGNFSHRASFCVDPSCIDLMNSIAGSSRSIILSTSLGLSEY